jgi:hypothetical protein
MDTGEGFGRREYMEGGRADAIALVAVSRLYWERTSARATQLLALRKGTGVSKT